jgi:hypothetical protein
MDQRTPGHPGSPRVGQDWSLVATSSQYRLLPQLREVAVRSLWSPEHDYDMSCIHLV